MDFKDSILARIEADNASAKREKDHGKRKARR